MIKKICSDNSRIPLAPPRIPPPEILQPIQNACDNRKVSGFGFFWNSAFFIEQYLTPEFIIYKFSIGDRLCGRTYCYSVW